MNKHLFKVQNTQKIKIKIIIFITHFGLFVLQQF